MVSGPSTLLAVVFTAALWISSQSVVDMFIPPRNIVGIVRVGSHWLASWILLALHGSTIQSFYGTSNWWSLAVNVCLVYLVAAFWYNHIIELLGQSKVVAAKQVVDCSPPLSSPQAGASCTPQPLVRLFNLAAYGSGAVLLILSGVRVLSAIAHLIAMAADSALLSALTTSPLVPSLLPIASLLVSLTLAVLYLRERAAHAEKDCVGGLAKPNLSRDPAMEKKRVATYPQA
jgi:uncharacterized membrane protein